MKKFLSATLAFCLVALTSGCMLPTGGTDLSDVADRVGMETITTGDGQYGDYTATGHYTGTEIGFAVGIPLVIKLLEVPPRPETNNEALLQHVAESASADGATAMINVTPHEELYIGFPFGIFGLYVDSAQGTGIQ